MEHNLSMPLVKKSALIRAHLLVFAVKYFLYLNRTQRQMTRILFHRKPSFPYERNAHQPVMAHDKIRHPTQGRIFIRHANDNDWLPFI